MIDFQAFGQEPPLKEKATKAKFTPEEDAKLIELVNQFGEEDWKLITTMMPGRNERQVHDRWSYYLSPSVKKDPFSPEEDALLLKMRAEFGPKWVKIAQSFPGRTDTNLKNRYNFLKRRDGVQSSSEIKTPALPTPANGQQITDQQTTCNSQFAQYQQFLLYQQQAYQQALQQARMQGYMDAQRMMIAGQQVQIPLPVPQNSISPKTTIPQTETQNLTPTSSPQFNVTVEEFHENPMGFESPSNATDFDGFMDYDPSNSFDVDSDDYL